MKKMDKRRERFLNYGVKQVNRAVENIERLKRFAERSNYIIEEEEMQRIIELLNEKIIELRDYYGSNKNTENIFSITKEKANHKSDNSDIVIPVNHPEDLQFFKKKWLEASEQNQMIKKSQDRQIVEIDRMSKQILHLDFLVKEIQKKLEGKK
jgi:hypothetical protein